MKAIIMAGGEGARLRPLTCSLPKPMVPLMSRPMMEYIVELLKYHGITDLGVTLQYIPEKIQDHFGSGETWGVNFSYFLEEEPLGTAGSVKNAGSFLDDTFIVISGDCLTDINLSRAVEFHRGKGGLATIVLTSQEIPLEYGIVIVNDKGEITSFLEKPRWGEVFSDKVNTGIYILEPEILQYIPEGKQFDFSKDLFPLLLNKGKPLFGCELPGYWCDIGNLNQYRHAHYDILDRKVELRLFAEEVEKDIWLEEGCDVHPQVELTPPLYISKNTFVDRGAVVGEHSVLGNNNLVHKNASVKKGITWSHVQLGKGSAIRGAVLNSGVRVEQGAAVYEESVVGDKCVLESRAVLNPKVKLWPHKRVESGAVVNENVIWGEHSKRFLFGVEGIKGDLNGDLSLEYTVKLGSAFAFWAGSSGSVVVAADSKPSSQLIKRAVSSGLMAGGVDVLDLKESVIPVERLSTAYLGALGGIFVQSLPHEGFNLIRFFDREGLDFSHGDARKLEQIISRDDFPRATWNKLGTFHQVEGFNSLYQKELLREVSNQKIKDASFSILIGNPPTHIENFLLPVLHEMGCSTTVVHFNGIYSPEGEEFNHYKIDLAEKVLNLNASLGVWIEPGGERMLLVDDEGREVSGEEYHALLSLLLLRGGRTFNLVQPVSASWAHEELARKNDGSVVRSKTFPRHFQENIKENSAARAQGDRSREQFSIQMMQIDAVSALAKLLELLAVENKSLSRLRSELPDIKIKSKEISCPWNRKGHIMRRLVEEPPGVADKIELLDGVKFFFQNGWALVIPDPEKPTYRIYGEGFTEKISESLTDFFAQKVKELQDEKNK